jgi:uncharacterized GH25 family protein
MRTRSFAALAFLLCSAAPALAAISGVVMTTDGQPVAGARVSIYPLETGEARRARLLSDKPAEVPISAVETDAKGNFSLESPKDTLVDLEVTAKGYYGESRVIERDEDVGAIALSKAEIKSGTITAGNGKPVAGATVALSYLGSEYITRTDDAGRYEAPDPKRARVLVVNHPQFALTEVQALGRSGIANLNQTLAMGSKITGVVLGLDGKPAPNVTIAVDGWPLATSGEGGAFTVERAPSKWSSITAQNGALIATRSYQKEPVTLRLAKAATIAGRVLDAKTKLPVAGAVVRAGQRMARMLNESATTGVTDAKGNYTLYVAPGQYMLFASHPAYDGRPVDITAAAGQAVSKEITLSPFARVSGTVLNDDRKPVAAAQITTQDAREGMDFIGGRMFMMGGGNTVSGPDGRFSMRVRSEADLKLRAAKKGLPAANSEAFKLAPAERRSGFVLTIPNGIAVTGIVTDASGKPLSGVSVASAPTPPSSRGMVQRVIMGGGPPADEDSVVRTDSEGRFEIRVTEGTHDFSFKRDGFSTKHVRAKSITVSGPNTVEATLDPSVEITGRVVRGGAGVENVGIFVFSMEGDSSEATTGPDGSFTLRNLSPGPARVSMRKEDELISENRSLTAPARDVVIELPAGTRVSGRVIDKATRRPLSAFQVGISTARSGGGMVMMTPPVMKNVTSDDGTFTLDYVPAGAMNFVAQAPGYSTTRLNLNVEENKPITDLEIELDMGVKLAGKVTGPDGTPVSDASVSLAFLPSSNTPVMRGQDKRTTTNSSGEFELDGLEAGEETIEVSHPKYLTERKAVTLKGRDNKLDVQLSAGMKVSGVVVTEGGAPVADAEVSAFTAGGAQRRTKTDTSGRFELDSLSKARYQFRASKTGLADGQIKDFDVSSGAPLRLVMKSGAVVYGSVRGLTETELASAVVEAYSNDGSSNATIDANGQYRLEGVPSGTVRIQAVVMGRNFSGRKTSVPQTVEISAGGSQQLDLEFRGDTVIKGRVSRNGKPIAGANVTFFPRPGGPQTSTMVTADEQGNYSASGLEPGQYNVSVSDMQRFSTYQTTYEVRGSSTFDIEYSATGVRGRVVDASTHEPLGDARVQLRANNTGPDSPRFPARVSATDANGVFMLDSIPTGSYTLSADKTGFGNYSKTIQVGDSDLADVELPLSKTEGITIKVVDARDNRALGAAVVVFDTAGRQVQEQRGFFPGMEAGETKLALSPGTYVVTVGTQGYGTRSVTLRAPGSHTIPLMPSARINVKSKHSERVRVRLLDASGMWYPRWTETFTGAWLNPNVTTTLDVAGGSYTLQLLGDGDAVLDSRTITVGDGQTVNVEI